MFLSRDAVGGFKLLLLVACVCGLQCLREQGLYESQEEAVRREEVLGALDKLAKQWVRRVTKACGMGEYAEAEANAKIFTFGSYRLGVHGPGTRGMHMHVAGSGACCLISCHVHPALVQAAPLRMHAMCYNCRMRLHACTDNAAACLCQLVRLCILAILPRPCTRW